MQLLTDKNMYNQEESLWVSLSALLSVAYALVLRKVLSNNLKESNDEK